MDKYLRNVQGAVGKLDLQNKVDKTSAVSYDPENDLVVPTSKNSASDNGSWVFVEHGAKKPEDNKSSKDTIREGEKVSDDKVSEPSKGTLSIQDWQSLFDAVQNKDEEKVKSLLIKEAVFRSFGKKTLDTKSPDGPTLLYQAILDSQVSIAKLLLTYGADPNAATGKWPQQKCLQQAVLLGHDELVQILLDNGANVLLEDRSYQTALHAAASKGNLTLASLLLGRGANINQKGSRFITPLAAAVENTQVEMMEYLVTQGSEVTTDKKSLELAVKKDHLGMVEFLFKNGAASKTSTEELGNMLIDRAQSGKEPGVVAALLKYGAPVDAENGAPLECAIRHFDQNPIIDLLLDNGADPKFKRTPYNGERTMEEQALHTNNPDIVQVFLEKGRGTRSRNEVLKEYVRYSAALPDGMGHEIVKYLIDQGAEGNLRTSTDYPASGTMMSPLQWAANNRDLEMVQARIAKDDNIEGLSVCHTPLQFASMNSDENMVQVLLSHGAKPNSIGQNRFGKMLMTTNTPLQLAVDRKHLGITKCLLENGADANLGNPSINPLATAAKRGDIAFVELLLAHGAKTFLSGSGFTDPLFAACYMGHREVVQKLLKEDLSADEIRTESVGALHAAAGKGHLEIVRIILDRGGDVNGWSSYQSLIFAATKEGNEDVVKLLVDRGADPNAKGNSAGVSAMEKATETCDEMLMEALSAPR